MRFRTLIKSGVFLGSVVNADLANESLLWGTYRPNLYFGMRPRIPESVMTGLLWFGVKDYNSVSQARHSCEQGDALQSYTFTEHDGRNYAKQTIKDSLNNVELTTRLLKFPGGGKGGSWGVRIDGKPLDASQAMRISLVNYIGDNAALGSLQLTNPQDIHGLEGDIRLTGSSPALEEFKFTISEDPSNQTPATGPHVKDFNAQLDKTQFYATQVPSGDIWHAKAILMNTFLKDASKIVNSYKDKGYPDPASVLSLPNQASKNANIFGFQKVFDEPFSIDMYFESASLDFVLDRDTLSRGLEAASLAYRKRFSTTFPQLSLFSEEQVEFSQAITSNLLGGIGYFYGSSLIDRNFAHEWDDEDAGGKDPQPEYTPNRELFTATPSRSFFPRGFYWDEGFHLLLIGAWDNDLSLAILQDWIGLIDEDGWVGREQILGEEARSKVPVEFQTQYPSYANPPTLAMAVTAYIDRLKEAQSRDLGSFDTELSGEALETLANIHINDSELAGAFLRKIYGKLKLHFEWFQDTQKGQLKEWGRVATSRSEGYRWRGRTLDHVLTSGLDDYPRARPPHLGELHLDLISWMAFFTKTMSDIAEFVGEADDADEFKAKYKAIVANIDDLHWNEEKQMYCDVSIDEDDEDYFVCHKGYISLFPFLLGLLSPDSEHLGSILKMIRSPEHLWSSYGIRSLSKSDQYFGQGENYWRGPIWIQMNYMVLSSLYKIYAKEPGPHQVQAAEIYTELRENVINNVFKEYQRTGYAWEQYDPITGEGKRSHPFTGWTSLVTLIMAEKY